MKKERCFDSWQSQSNSPRTKWLVLPGVKRQQKPLKSVLKEGFELSRDTGNAGEDSLFRMAFPPLFTSAPFRSTALSSPVNLSLCRLQGLSGLCLASGGMTSHLLLQLSFPRGLLITFLMDGCCTWICCGHLGHFVSQYKSPFFPNWNSKGNSTPRPEVMVVLPVMLACCFWAIWNTSLLISSPTFTPKFIFLLYIKH